jgi:superfamily II DNA or RNA helicase
VLELCYERLELFESLGSTEGKLRAVEEVASVRRPTLVLSRFQHSAGTLLQKLRDARLAVDQADGSMRRERIERLTRSFREATADEQRCLIITRELGGRGLDFPNAGSAVMVSPRSNYQAVAQELARIRSRQEDVKEASILYFANTEEEAKARRLGDHLRRERFQERHLFETVDLPGTGYTLERFESRNLRHEESLDQRTLARLGLPAAAVRA